MGALGMRSSRVSPSLEEIVYESFDPCTCPMRLAVHVCV